MSGNVLIMAGGTGGHVFPALAVAEALRQRAVTVSWLGTPLGIEARVVPDAGIDLDWINVRGVRGQGVLTRLAAPFRIVRAGVQALRVVRRRRPHAVLGMGGFASGPGGVAARLLGRPLVIHEQNAVAGLTNRWLARLATRVLCAFPGAFPERVQVDVVGNPLRSDFALSHDRAASRGEHDTPRVLVVGGSQGALALNRLVPAALAKLTVSFEVRHQCGERHIETARTAYNDANVRADVVPFIDDMAAAYRWADLVVCRAGALTVSEIAASGVAAVFIPFPFAVDDHQTANATFLAAADAAVILSETTLTADTLARELNSLLSDRPRRDAMAERARSVARFDATDAVVQALLSFLPGQAEATS